MTDEKSQFDKSNQRVRDQIVRSIGIERHNKRSIIGPEDASYREMIQALRLKMEEEEKIIQVQEVMQDVFWTEGLIAIQRCFAEHFGGYAAAKGQRHPFTGDEMPPRFETVQVGPSLADTVEVPIDQFQVLGIKGVFEVNSAVKARRQCFAISAHIPAKHRKDFQFICEEVKRNRREHSIYRGHYLRMQWNEEDFPYPVLIAPQYLATPVVSPDDLIFSPDVERRLRYNLFGHLENHKRLKAAGNRVEKKVVLAGHFGTGKSMAMAAAVNVGLPAGWTAIDCPNPDHLESALQFAKEYQPCLVLIEDLDQRLSGDARDERMNELLNTLDGVLSKGQEVFLLATTNYMSRLNQAAARPGRLDKIITIPKPGPEEARRLVQLYGKGQLSQDLDWEAIGERLADNIPAMIEHVVREARAAMVMDGGQSITTEMVMAFADDMQEQMDLVNRPEERSPSDRERAATILADGLAKGGASRVA